MPIFKTLSLRRVLIQIMREQTLLSRGIDAKRCEKEENINAAIRNSIIVSNSNAIRDCNVFVICVPTGVTSSHEPDLFPLKSACFVVGSNLKKGDLVIFESTVFPGATDENMYSYP